MRDIQGRKFERRIGSFVGRLVNKKNYIDFKSEFPFRIVNDRKSQIV
jgi:hypothetical protein